MRHISVLDFRKNSKKILDGARRGERMIMTYRGKAVFRLEPITQDLPLEDDPFYQLAHLTPSTKGINMTNQDMDKVIYGA